MFPIPVGKGASSTGDSPKEQAFNTQATDEPQYGGRPEEGVPVGEEENIHLPNEKKTSHTKASADKTKTEEETPINSGPFLCILGCLALAGCRNRVVRRLAFAPPTSPGYKIRTVQKGTEILLTGVEPNVNVTELLRQQSVISISYHRLRKFWKSPLACFLFTNSALGPLSEAPLIIFSHGNSTDIGYMMPHLYYLCAKIRVNILAYDYSGYGLSRGTASEKNVYKDIKRVWTFATGTLKVSPHKIVLYGQSVGSAPTCYMASQSNFEGGGVVLHSGIASGLRIFINDLDKSPWFDAFRNIDRVKDIPCPIYFMHGIEDKQVNQAHSVKMLKAALQGSAAPRTETTGISPRSSNEAIKCRSLRKDANGRVWYWWVPDADHNDIEEKHPEQYYEQMKEFMDFATRPKDQMESPKLA